MFRVQVFKCSDFQVFRCSGVEVFRCLGVQVFRCLGVQVLRFWVLGFGMKMVWGDEKMQG